MANLKKFVAATIQNGGASFSLETGEINPTAGYMVAISGHEKIVPNVTNSKQLQYIVAEYIKEHAIILAAGMSQNTFMGTWLHENKLYLDVSKNVTDKASAVRMAIENNQLAIWDNSNNSEIKIKF
jgi:hypothetical protein